MARLCQGAMQISSSTLAQCSKFFRLLGPFLACIREGLVARGHYPWWESVQFSMGFLVTFVYNMSDMSASCSYSRFLTKRKALQSLSWTTKKISSLGLCQSSVMEISIDCQQNTVPQKTFKQKIRRPQQSAGGARPRKSFSRITLGTRLHRNVSRRLWRPSSVSFGHVPGAFLEIFFWFQKATLALGCTETCPGALGGPAACLLATCRALSWRFSSGFRQQR